MAARAAPTCSTRTGSTTCSAPWPPSARGARPASGCRGGGLTTTSFEQTGISSAVIDDAVDGAPAAITFMDWHTMLASSQRARRSPAWTARATSPSTPRWSASTAARPASCARTRPWTWCARAMPRTTPEQELAAVRRAPATACRGGPDGDARHGRDARRRWSSCATLESRGELVTRILLPFTIEPDTPEELWEIYARRRAEHGRRWRAGVAKFFIDGVIDSGTGWLVEPDTEGDGRVVVLARRRPVPPGGGASSPRAGFQCVTHATGDRGVREALDTYARPGAAPGCATGSSTSRRSSLTTCRGSPPRGWSPRCRPST